MAKVQTPTESNQIQLELTPQELAVINAALSKLQVPYTDLEFAYELKIKLANASNINK